MRSTRANSSALRTTQLVLVGDIVASHYGTPTTIANLTQTWSYDTSGVTDMYWTGVAGGAGVASTANFLPFGFSFSLQDCITNQAAFTSVFDQYMLYKVTVDWKGVFVTTLDTTAQSVGYPGSLYQLKIATCVDTNSATPVSNSLTGYRQIMGYDNARESILDTTVPNKTIIRQVIRPNILLGVEDTNGSLGVNGQKGPMWLNCQDNSIIHYGIRGIISLNVPTLANLSRLEFRVTPVIKYYLKFRKVR